MTQLQSNPQNDAQAVTPPTTEVTEASAAPAGPVGHETPGLVVTPHTEGGALVMKTLNAEGVLLPVSLMHSETAEPLTWAALAVSSRDAAVSGWFPGKLGGWVKLDWRDGGFAADAWTSDGAGMTAYDAAMRAKKQA